MKSFGSRRTLRATFDEALVRVPEALKSEGFGVLTEIDVQSTFKAKLDVEFRRYKILGACNPAFSHAALSVELEAGLMMPCNVVLFEDDEHHAVLLAVDPMTTVASTGNPKLVELAQAVGARLVRALAKVE